MSDRHGSRVIPCAAANVCDIWMEYFYLCFQNRLYLATQVSSFCFSQSFQALIECQMIVRAYCMVRLFTPLWYNMVRFPPATFKVFAAWYDWWIFTATWFRRRTFRLRSHCRPESDPPSEHTLGSVNSTSHTESELFKSEFICGSKSDASIYFFKCAFSLIRNVTFFWDPLLTLNIRHDRAQDRITNKNITAKITLVVLKFWM